MTRGADPEVVALARRIAELGGHQRAGVYRMSWWSERLLNWAMEDPAFKTQLFRLVDVFPATGDDEDVAAHVREYLGSVPAPRLLNAGMGLAERVPLGERATAAVLRRNIARMARQFIVGTGPRQAVSGLGALWRSGRAATVDLLGEHTHSEPEADRYAARLDGLLDALVATAAGWPPDDHLERDDLGPLPRASVSIKPTALASHFTPLTGELGLAEATGRLGPILRRAAAEGASVWFDMERYDVKELTHRLVRQVLDDPALTGLHAGVVVQAYLKDSMADLADLAAWSADRRRRLGEAAQPLAVRLVKGAYWDTETIQARAAGWPVPVFEDKPETDANFERCVRFLHDQHGTLRAAFATHNLRSIACAVTEGRRLGIPDTGYELQLLYGMAEPVHAALVRLGLRVRVYAPVGELVPGMAYLVRRLLENTSNESFVRLRFAERRQLDSLVQAELPEVLPAPEAPHRVPVTDAGKPAPYSPEPPAEWRRGRARQSFAAALCRFRPPILVPALVDGEPVTLADTFCSTDPSRPDQVVATAAECGPSEAEAAVDSAVRAADGWAATPVVDRAAVLFRAADWMRQRRADLAAVEVYEAGKPWAEADADVCEAIDYCEYYGRRIIDLAAGGAVQSPPGEQNRLTYHGRGVAAVISPWNFPLAIATGMTTAALVAGNAVVLKPAEQTPGVAWRLVEALRAGGVPRGVLGFLPGAGAVGAALVRDPRVSVIAFTGSKTVGLEIVAEAARVRPGQHHVKRVVAEMGGKNAIVVDSDADLDEVVPAVIHSAFGYSGQKCSAAARLVAVDGVHDQLVERLVAAARALRVGAAEEMETQVGPLIEAEAQQRVLRYVADAPRHGRVLLARDDVPPQGWFAGPAIVDDVAPGSPLATEEIFGPVLSVMRAHDFEEAIEVANDTEYGLTAGVFSRRPSRIALATARLRAGNVYVNRAITGATVGRQPFGGVGLSGVGSKAGGP
ncbi:MAG TPA: proline dehydrogenase family protein [Acidimicrobiales bacterium]|nr:proline dehydrogenase family protein [Acidimicrobiales bacterium]